MTTVTFRMEGDRITGFDSQGHSGYAESGSDIVCAAITSAIRFWGNMAEGVSFAILLMNLWVPYINDLTHQVPLGYKKPEKKKEAAK